MTNIEVKLMDINFLISDVGALITEITADEEAREATGHSADDDLYDTL